MEKFETLERLKKIYIRIIPYILLMGFYILVIGLSFSGIIGNSKPLVGVILSYAFLFIYILFIHLVLTYKFGYKFLLIIDVLLMSTIILFQITYFGNR